MITSARLSCRILKCLTWALRGMIGWILCERSVTACGLKIKPPLPERDVLVPIHSFLCKNCGNLFADYFKLTSAVPEVKECPKCHFTSAFKEFPCPHTIKDFGKPVEMYSVAPVNPEDVEAFARSNPDIKLDTDPNSDMYGVPIVKNESERRKVMKYFGVVDKEKPAGR